MPSKAQPEFAVALLEEVRGLHRKCCRNSYDTRGKTRQKARSLLFNSNPSLTTELWIAQLEASLYYASGCAVDSRYARLVRGASANLRRSQSAINYPADTWAFLPLLVLSRDNRSVHLERVRHMIANYERTGKINDADKERLKSEIDIYQDTDLETWTHLSEQFEACCRQPEEEEDWEDETCPYCNSKKTRLINQLQLRSADEPMTLFYKCYNCHGDFRLD